MGGSTRDAVGRSVRWPPWVGSVAVGRGGEERSAPPARDAVCMNESVAATHAAARGRIVEGV